jgi:protein-S-isoprenylcysteine O-methyltransferase Ste14
MVSMGQLRRCWDSPIIARTCRVKRGPAKGVSVRLFLGVAVIAVGVANLCLQHRWHRVLGVVAIAIGLILCALVWVR